MYLAENVQNILIHKFSMQNTWCVSESQGMNYTENSIENV
jgi:hypothetical protein